MRRNNHNSTKVSTVPPRQSSKWFSTDSVRVNLLQGGRRASSADEEGFGVPGYEDDHSVLQIHAKLVDQDSDVAGTPASKTAEGSLLFVTDNFPRSFCWRCWQCQHRINQSTEQRIRRWMPARQCAYAQSSSRRTGDAKLRPRTSDGSK